MHCLFLLVGFLFVAYGYLVSDGQNSIYKEGKTYSNIYKEEWIQPLPMGSNIYPKVHENPRAFFSSSSPSL